MAKVLYLVVPCYNEETVLPTTSQVILAKMQKLISAGIISSSSKIVFVDDGSKDQTWKIISALHKENSIFQGIKLTRNRGHQNALLAGLLTVKDCCDVTISLDADLQDDINAIDEMLEKYYNGCEIVYGIRNSRETDTLFKRLTAEAYYKILQAFGADVVYNHADFRLMSKNAVEGLADFEEVNLFLRGIVPMIGYQSDNVYYDRQPRIKGESKYPVSKMISLALEGITSLSIKPLRMIAISGFSMFVLGLFILIIAIIARLAEDIDTSLIMILASIWSSCGLQLGAIGILGEYTGKTYLETKKRPRYIVEAYLC